MLNPLFSPNPPCSNVRSSPDSGVRVPMEALDQRRAGPESPDLLRRLVAVGRALAETRDQTAICRTLREFVAEFVPFDTFLISLLDAETLTRRCAYCWGDGVEVDTSLFEPLPLNEGPPSQALVT